jgi:hypothetical protein
LERHAAPSTPRLIVDEVWKELAKERAYNAYLSATAGRTLVARKVFQLAQSQWSAIQIKQLLLRAVRNEISMRRRKKCGAPTEMKGETAPLSPQTRF